MSPLIFTWETLAAWGSSSQVNSIFIIIVYNKDYSGLQNDILSASTLGYLVEEHQPPEADIIIIEQHQDRHRSQEPIDLMNKDIVQEGWRCSQWSWWKRISLNAPGWSWIQPTRDNQCQYHCKTPRLSPLSRKPKSWCDQKFRINI